MTSIVVNKEVRVAETISKRRYGGVDPAERRSARRDRLIEAAIGLYGRQGYRNTGVRAVCQEAGLTERYFYESFANSEALLAAAYDAVVTRLIDALREAGGDASMPVTARGARMLESYFSTIRAHPAEARVFLVEITGVSPTIDDAIRRSLERFAELILDMHDPRRAGPLAAEPLLRRGVVGGLHQIAIAWAEGEGERTLDEVVAAAMPLCLLARPIAAETRS
jgi:AcrR family transcriptional regulator